MVFSLLNSSMDLTLVSKFSVTGGTRALPKHALEFVQLGSLHHSLGLFHFNDRAIEVFEEKAVPLDDSLVCLAINWNFLNLKQLDKVNVAANTMLVKNSFTLTLQNTVSLFGASDDPLKVA